MGIVTLILVMFAFVLVAIEAYRSKAPGWAGLAFWLLAEMIERLHLR